MFERWEYPNGSQCGLGVGEGAGNGTWCREAIFDEGAAPRLWLPRRCEARCREASVGEGAARRLAATERDACDFRA